MTTLRALELLLAKYQNAVGHVQALIKLEKEGQAPEVEATAVSSSSLIAYLQTRQHTVSVRKVATHFGVPIEQIRELLKSHDTGFRAGRGGMIHPIPTKP